MMFPKSPREVDEMYLQFVRTQPCVVASCNTKAEPHHLISRGAWGSDYTCIPMCRKHHSEIEQLGTDKFQHRYSLNTWQEAHRTLNKFVAIVRRERASD